MMIDKEPYKPFLKWAGGKRWFIDSYASLLPEQYNVYHEPFLGGGSVFFHLSPTSANLCDINPNLIEVYTSIKKDFAKVKRRLQFHNRKHSTEHYYKVREGLRGNEFSRAGDFIYLNRTCWNGLYRVNKAGKFNVPIGDRTSIIREADNFELISDLLEGVNIESTCFSKSLTAVGEGDFCFIDPPYTVKHDNNGFVRYNEQIFSWDNQVALRDSVAKIKQKGGMALVLNANHKSIKELYAGIGKIIPLSRRSMLAASSRHRGETKEIAIMVGYDI